MLEFLFYIAAIYLVFAVPFWIVRATANKISSAIREGKTRARYSRNRVEYYEDRLITPEVQLGIRSMPHAIDWREINHRAILEKMNELEWTFRADTEISGPDGEMVLKRIQAVRDGCEELQKKQDQIKKDYVEEQRRQRQEKFDKKERVAERRVRLIDRFCGANSYVVEKYSEAGVVGRLPGGGFGKSAVAPAWLCKSNVWEILKDGRRVYVICGGESRAQAISHLHSLVRNERRKGAIRRRDLANDMDWS